MGMKYTINENTLRLAVRQAIRGNESHRWTLTEGFITDFFNALSGALDKMKSQYEQDEIKQVEAKLFAAKRSLIQAILKEVDAQGLTQRGGGWGRVSGNFNQNGFAEYDWSEEKINNVIIQVIKNRMDTFLPKAIAQIGNVAKLPAIPGVSKDGTEAQSKEKGVENQEKSIEAAASDQMSVIRPAADALSYVYGDIGSLLAATDAYGKMDQLIQDAGFGATAVDFLHKAKMIDLIVAESNYGASVNQEASAMVRDACQQIRRAAEAGLQNYIKQGNYNAQTGTFAMPSDALVSKAEAKGGGEGSDSKKA